MIASYIPWTLLLYIVVILVCVTTALVVTGNPACLLGLAFLNAMPDVPILAPQASAPAEPEPRSIGFMAEVD